MQEDIEVFTVRNSDDHISLSATIDNNSATIDNDIEDIRNILYKMIEDMNKRNRNLWRYRIR